jgi:hypothetical protein
MAMRRSCASRFCAQLLAHAGGEKHHVAALARFAGSNVGIQEQIVGVVAILLGHRANIDVHADGLARHLHALVDFLQQSAHLRRQRAIPQPGEIENELVAPQRPT